jgi:hypothetical protein
MPTDKLIPNIFYIFFLVSISALFNILKAWYPNPPNNINFPRIGI